MPGPGYRPLSLLALAGAFVAGGYAVVVVVGAVYAFWHGDPWLLPGWSAVFPIAGAGLSLSGLVRVRRAPRGLSGAGSWRAGACC